MSAEAETFLQTIMDRAYQAEWPKGGSFGDFLGNMDPADAEVAAIGKLNQQVCNGGFMQWRDNGYSDDDGFLRRALRRLNTETARKVLDLVRRAHEVPEWASEEEADSASDELAELDSAFYDLNDQLLIDLANRLKGEA